MLSRPPKLVPIATALVQMQRGADVEHVAQAGLGRIAHDVARPARLAAAGIVRRHHAPSGAERLGQRLEVARGAHDAGQAQQRRMRIAVPPFADNERKAVPGGDPMDYCVHCASSVGVLSPRRAR